MAEDAVIFRSVPGSLYVPMRERENQDESRSKSRNDGDPAAALHSVFLARVAARRQEFNLRNH
jgi:hypothetical protein